MLMNNIQPILDRTLAGERLTAETLDYIQQTLEFRYQTSSEAAQWLGQQIEEQKTKVEEADRALQKVKEQEGIVNIEERRISSGFHRLSGTVFLSACVALPSACTSRAEALRATATLWRVPLSSVLESSATRRPLTQRSLAAC